MLVPILFIVAFMLALTGAALEQSNLAATSSAHAAVAQYSDVAIADGVADFTHGLATFVRLHGAGGPWPRATSRSALKSTCAPTVDGPPCSLHYVISGTLTAASQNRSTGAADAALNLQAAVIDEQRVSAAVTATVFAPNGAVLGARTRFITYRVFDTAPYAVISGSRDIAATNDAPSAAQGDSGGEPAADDTRIHVRLACATVIQNVRPFANDQQPAGNDGLPWGNAAGAAYEAPCTTADEPADAFQTESWTNGDANATGWTQ